MSECEFCHSVVKNKSSHLSTNKKCLKIRGSSLQTNHICEGCNIIFKANNVLKTHQNGCKDYIIFSLKNEYLQKLEEIEEKNLNQNKQKISSLCLENKELSYQVSSLKEQNEKLELKIEKFETILENTLKRCC